MMNPFLATMTKHMRERERERERGCKKLYYANNQQKLQKITVHKVILIHSKIE